MKVLRYCRQLSSNNHSVKLSLPGSLGSAESLPRPGSRMWSSSRRYHQPDLAAGERNSPPEVYLDLDLSGCWFFLDLFSQSRLEMP